MIPKVKAYEDTKVSANKTRFEVEEMLQKHFGVTLTAWKREDPEKTYFAFQYKSEALEKPLTYKVQVPFIEKKMRKEKNNRYSPMVPTYDEPRSYRFFFHIFKAMFLNTQIGMTLEETFSSYLVVGELADGTPVNVQEKILTKIASGTLPALELK